MGRCGECGKEAETEGELATISWLGVCWKHWGYSKRDWTRKLRINDKESNR